MCQARRRQSCEARGRQGGEVRGRQGGEARGRQGRSVEDPLTVKPKIIPYVVVMATNP